MTGKQRAAAGFAAFLIFMAVCTLIARGVYTSGLARITIMSPEKKNIIHEVNVQGAVKQGQEFGVYVEPGLRVNTVVVRNGESFDQGAPLFQIDPDDLKDIITQKELELAKLAGQQKGYAGSAAQEQNRQNAELDRAQEDYDTAVRDADLAIGRTRLTLTKAEDSLKEYKKYLESLPGGQVSGGDNTDGSAGGGIGGQEHSEKLRQLEQAVLEAAQAVEDALLAKDDALKAAGRKIEDARLAGQNGFSPDRESARLDADFKRGQLEELKKLMEDEGWVYAQEAGKVTGQKILVGERTPDTACLLYALDDGNRIVEAVLTPEQAKYVSLGDTAELAFKNKTGATSKQDAVVEYLESREDGNVLAQMQLEDANVDIGQNVDVGFTKQSESYDKCIPVNSLVSDGRSGYFVYVAEEHEGILGKEWRIRKIPVTVLDQNNSFAALEAAAIGENTAVVESYDKEIAEGDVVRIIEE